MYYEEKTIDGVRYYRTSPKDTWRKKAPLEAISAMNRLAPEERLLVLRRFCPHCGQIWTGRHICPKEIP